MCCLSKGLGAPVGLVLAGPADAHRRGPRRPPAPRRGHAPGRRARRRRPRRPRAPCRAARRRPPPGPAAGRRRRRALARRRARSRRACAPTWSSSATPDPRGLLRHLRAEGVRAGTIAPGVVRLVTHLDVDDAGIDRAIAGAGRGADMTASSRRSTRARRGRSPSTPTPTTPRCRAAARWPRWAAAGAEVHLSSAPGARRARPTPTSTPTRWPSSGPAEMAEAAAVLGLAGHELLGYPDGELENTVEVRGRLVELHPHASGPTWCSPRPDRGVLRRPLRQPPRPPGRRLGHARRVRAGGGQPALLPRRRAAPPGGDAAAVGHARARRLGRHRRGHRREGGGAALPSQPARRRHRPGGRRRARARAGERPSRRRRRGHLLPRRSAAATDLVELLGRRARWMVCHSPMARSASTTITATPPAATTAPTMAPSPVGTLQSPSHWRSVKA